MVMEVIDKIVVAGHVFELGKQISIWMNADFVIRFIDNEITFRASRVVGDVANCEIIDKKPFKHRWAS
jgi:hypothetical protein